MPILSRLRSAYRSVFHAAEVQRELDEELNCALEELTARHAARGLSHEAASRLARQDLGRTDAIKEEVHSRGLGHLLETVARDVVHAARSVRRMPAFSAVIVLILAAAIGAATAVFSVVNALLIAPLPYKDGHQLMFIWQDLTSVGYPRAPLSGPELQDLRDRSTLITGFGGVWANTAALTDGTEPEQLRVGLVTSNFFDVLGADARLGRTFRPGDDGRDGPGGILLSGELWKRRYGGDPALPGKRILVNGTPTTVLGVMPETFRLLLPAMRPSRTISRHGCYWAATA